MADSVEMGRDLAQVEANLVIVPLVALAIGHSHEHHGPDPLICDSLQTSKSEPTSVFRGPPLRELVFSRNLYPKHPPLF